MVLLFQVFTPLNVVISHVSVCRGNSWSNFPLPASTSDMPMSGKSHKVLVHLSLPASAYSYGRGCGFWRGRERSRVGLSYHDGLGLLGVQLRHCPAEAFGCRGGDVRGWHLCSSTSSAVCFPAPCQLFIGQDWRQRLFQIFSSPATSPSSPPSFLPLRLRGGGDMKERNVSVPLNLIATKIADTLPSQTRQSPTCFPAS